MGLGTRGLLLAGELVDKAQRVSETPSRYTGEEIPDQARTILAGLRNRGFAHEIDTHGLTQYRVRLAPKRGRAQPLNL